LGEEQRCAAYSKIHQVNDVTTSTTTSTAASTTDHNRAMREQCGFVWSVHKTHFPHFNMSLLVCVPVSKPMYLFQLQKKLYQSPCTSFNFGKNLSCSQFFFFGHDWTDVPKRYQTPRVYLSILIGFKYLNPDMRLKVFSM
jgi:hypothetical protein